MKRVIDIVENECPNRMYKATLSEGAKKVMKTILKKGGRIVNGKYKGRWIGIKVEEEEILTEKISTVMYCPNFLGYKYSPVKKYRIFRMWEDGKVRLALKELY